MTAVVDARFAGGSIIIGQGHATYDPTTKLVTIDAPDWDAALFPHEARQLAAALTAAADEAEKLEMTIDPSREVSTT